MKSKMNRRVDAVKTVRSGGEDVFHVVSLEGGGFVVTPADDQIEPVIAFADEGTLAEDERNPLWALLTSDLPRRLKALRSGQTKPLDPTRLRGRGGLGRRKQPAEEWGELLTNRATAATMSASPSLAQPADVRVDALLQSAWAQSTVAGLPCYNYYTPNGYVCGCVATAGGQLMRYHRHPTAAVSPQTFTCTVDETSVSKTMAGGVYSWDDMPLKPNSSATEAQRQAIGKLCYDVGVASRMQWTNGESGTVDAFLAQSLVNVFGYANAMCEMNQDGAGIGSDKIEDAIYANLDAGYPVLLGILDNSTSGHEIVADGYGLYNGTIYTHLNLGWSGTGNAWYALPSVSAGGYNFTILGSIVYNVFPDRSGELVTGRVLDEDGTPIPGVTVTAAYKTGSWWTQTTVTREAVSNASGIYALVVDSGCSCTVSASKSGFATATATVAVGTSKSTTFVESSMQYYPDSGVVGNRWGNDLTLVDNSKALDSVEIRGPSGIFKGSAATYVCAAKYGSGAVKPVQATWNIASGSNYATVNGTSGRLTAKSTSKDRTVMLSVSYTENGVRKTATKSVSVRKSDPRPANDSFAGAVTISEASGISATVDSTNATDEPDEPLMSFEPSAVGTLWWKWTAPCDGTVSFSANGSDFPSVVGVYAGSSLTALRKVAEGNDTIGFTCSQGSVYAIAVGGCCGDRGNTVLSWRLTPRKPGFLLLLR